MVLGDTPKVERARIIAEFKNGSLNCVVGNNVLTTGFDAPGIDFIGLLRPTASKGLHLQMLGRGLRIAEGKTDCLVADFAGNCLRHGPIDMMDGSKSGGDGTAPMKECPECSALLYSFARKCPHCDYEYPIDDTPKISDVPDTGPIFSNQIVKREAWYDVSDIWARRHKKPGTADSLRIDFMCGLRTFSHWLPLENPAAFGMARKWWDRHSSGGTPPESVDEALTRIDELRVPGRIQVVRDGKWDRVTKLDYSVPRDFPISIKRSTQRAA